MRVDKEATCGTNCEVIENGQLILQLRLSGIRAGEEEKEEEAGVYLYLVKWNTVTNNNSLVSVSGDLLKRYRSITIDHDLNQ